jgi:hypothetical protein
MQRASSDAQTANAFDPGPVSINCSISEKRFSNADETSSYLAS